MQSGASDLIPIDSRRSDDEPIVGAIAGAAGAASIFTSTGLLTAAGAATTAGAFGVSALAIGAY